MNVIDRRLARIEAQLNGRGSNLLGILIQGLETHGRDAMAGVTQRVAAAQRVDVALPKLLRWACPDEDDRELFRGLVTDADLEAARGCR